MITFEEELKELLADMAEGARMEIDLRTAFILLMACRNLEKIAYERRETERLLLEQDRRGIERREEDRRVQERRKPVGKVTYRKWGGKSSTNLMVYLDGVRTGTIRIVADGYRYFPWKRDEGGELFPTIEECKKSLEGEDDETEV